MEISGFLVDNFRLVVFGAIKVSAQVIELRKRDKNSDRKVSDRDALELARRIVELPPELREVVVSMLDELTNTQNKKHNEGGDK